MDLVLFGITAFALVLAAAMGAILFKVLRDERQRSDARVALLMAAAGVEPSLRLHDPEPVAPAATADHTHESHGELFTVREIASPWRRRVMVAFALAAFVAVTGYALLPRHVSTAGALSQATPLELLALHHAQEIDRLTITGLVQNPRTGVALSHVAATAFVFGADGNLLGSGRAELDYPALAPGDESPFVIKVPVTDAVAKYRVGFRGPDGSVIAHVDKRSIGTSARNGQITGSTPWAH
jgi:hypothetical protein